MPKKRRASFSKRLATLETHSNTVIHIHHSRFPISAPERCGRVQPCFTVSDARTDFVARQSQTESLLPRFPCFVPSHAAADCIIITSVSTICRYNKKLSSCPWRAVRKSHYPPCAIVAPRFTGWILDTWIAPAICYRCAACHAAHSKGFCTSDGLYSLAKVLGEKHFFTYRALFSPFVYPLAQILYISFLIHF